MSTQEEASEEPKTAAKIGAHANYELYFRNKLCAPLSEIFQTCLSPAQVQARSLRQRQAVDSHSACSALACGSGSRLCANRGCAARAVAVEWAAHPDESGPFGGISRGRFEARRSEGASAASAGAVLQGQRQVPGLPATHLSHIRR